MDGAASGRHDLSSPISPCGGCTGLQIPIASSNCTLAGHNTGTGNGGTLLEGNHSNMTHHLPSHVSSDNSPLQTRNDLTPYSLSSVRLEGYQSDINPNPQSGGTLDGFLTGEQSNMTPYPLSSMTPERQPCYKEHYFTSVHPSPPKTEHSSLTVTSPTDDKTLFKHSSNSMLPVSSSSNGWKGLDFPAPVSVTGATTTSVTSLIGVNRLYPDISMEFGISESVQSTESSPSEWHASQMAMPSDASESSPSEWHASQMPMPIGVPFSPTYGWNCNLTMMREPVDGDNPVLCPTTPIFGPLSAPSVQSYELESSIPAYANNIATDTIFTGSAFRNENDELNRQSGAICNINDGFIKSAPDANIPKNIYDSSINLVPNLDSNAVSNWNTFPYMEMLTEPTIETQRRENNDVVQLGFEGILTQEEKEYFSLQSFDPLQERRILLELSPNLSSNVFIAMPTESVDIVSNNRNTWLMFDQDGKMLTGHEQQVDVVREMETKPVQYYDEEHILVNDIKGYEKLQTRLVIDEDSENFCQMVADIKKQYKYTDEGTNLGYVVSPMCNIQQGSLSVKVVVYSCYTEEPMSFTTDVNSLVDHIISHILYVCLAGCWPSYMNQTLKSVDYILKINGRLEYLLNEYPLSKFSYTHDCLKMDQDLCFRILLRHDVTLPFLRTIDDDNQQLYFPQEHVKNTHVTRESLQNLMDTFFIEIEKLRGFVLKDEVESVQHWAIYQAVKAICTSLSKIETISIATCLHRVESQIKKLKANLLSKSSTLIQLDECYSASQRESLQALESLVTAVKQLIRIYCQAFHTDFHLSNTVVQPWDPQDVSCCSEKFNIHIYSVHRIPNDWESRFEEYKIESSLYYGKKKLGLSSTSTCASLCNSGLVPVIIWDERLAHDEMFFNNLPRECRLCLTLIGVKNVETGTSESLKETVPIGGVTIQLFNRKGYLLQGHQLVPLKMNSAADPLVPFCSTLNSNAALLYFSLPDFNKQLVLSDPLKTQERSKKSFADLSPGIQEQIQEVIKKDCLSICTADQLALLWDCRYCLHEYPQLLPRILQAVGSWDSASLPEMHTLLKLWTTLQPMQSLELLLPQFPDLKVRAFAVDCLSKMPTDDLIDFIPQLIQALKYESYHSSALARLLLEQSMKSVRFAHQFFWLLKGATQDSLYVRRYELMFIALVSVTGKALYLEFLKQEEVVKVLQLTAERVQQTKGGDKESTLKRNLEVLQKLFESSIHKVLLPHNPGYEVSGVEINSCSFFTSNACPLKVVFRNTSEHLEPEYALFKVGDDLRLDMMTMQIIRIMDRLWLTEGLDLKMVTFNCLPTGPKRGLIEIITESDTLRKIQVTSGVTGSFKDEPIKDWLQKHNPTELDYQKAVENFMRSCAGYCVATYILGICDRHNDNIMLKKTGHLFHIDFNKIFGDSQMFGNIKRDRVKFVLTSDMAYVINDGEKQSDRFQHFIDICCTAFNILRKHTNLFINLVALMLRSGVTANIQSGIEFVRQALLPEITDTQAAVQFTRLIQESLNAKSTQINFFIHNLAHMKFSNHNEGTLLSFVPKVYSQQTDGRITRVVICDVQKRYSPEKHYIYILRVERENSKVPSYIYRTYTQFEEFQNKLAKLFPHINWTQLQERSFWGRSQVKSVAEKRKVLIECFLHELMSARVEVSHCDIVYSFFHPLLLDEQEAQHFGEDAALSYVVKDLQVKLSLEYVKDSLRVLIIHARNLKKMNGSEMPSTYIKTYLLPDPEKHTKQKTKVVKVSTNPTYNELIEYKISKDSLLQKTLQVSVWDYDVLKWDNCLGAVYIGLKNIDLADNAPKWYILANI